MQIVWHGNYVKYFEDGRESFGNKFNLRYMDIYSHGYTAPMVHLELDYKKPVTFNTAIRVEVYYVHTPAAKIIFEYKIYNIKTEELLCTGQSIQVFVDLNGELSLTNPEFYDNWKKEAGLNV
ncbi:MAG: acyl-CoA thioesterase [Flavobacteriales bacterium]|nr:acyl-CoA thioesterase [Flavobacteriales bacterium]